MPGVGPLLASSHAQYHTPWNPCAAPDQPTRPAGWLAASVACGLGVLGLCVYSLVPALAGTSLFVAPSTAIAAQSQAVGSLPLQGHHASRQAPREQWSAVDATRHAVSGIGPLQTHDRADRSMVHWNNPNKAAFLGGFAMLVVAAVRTLWFRAYRGQQESIAMVTVAGEEDCGCEGGGKTVMINDTTVDATLLRSLKVTTADGGQLPLSQVTGETGKAVVVFLRHLG